METRWWVEQPYDEHVYRRLMFMANPYDICAFTGEELEPDETTWINVFTRRGEPYLCALASLDNETGKLHWSPYGGFDYPSPYTMERVG